MLGRTGNGPAAAGRRAARAAALLLGAAALLGAAPAAADAAADTDGGAAPGGAAEIAEALQESPVLVDPAYASALPEEKAGAIAESIEESGEPLFVVVLPVAKGDRWQGEVDNLLEAVHDRSGLSEAHYIAFGGQSVEGADYPADSAYEEGGVNASLAALAPSYESDFEGTPGEEIERAVEIALSGEAERLYEDAKAGYEERNGGLFDTSGPLTWPILLAWAAGAAALIAGAVLLLVRVRRRAARTRHAVRAAPLTAFDNADAARLDELSERVGAEIVAVGERLSRAETGGRGGAEATEALQGALNAHTAAGKAHDAARDGEADLADEVGALVLLDVAEYRMARAAALAAGRRPPRERRHCYANPLHGTSTADTEWRPVGSRRSATVPLCSDCARAVRRRAAPKALVVRHGGADLPYYTVPAEESVWSATGFGALRSDLVDRILRGDLRTPDREPRG
ncbi:hypothetical protein [Nocardiopsis potens]|uniref:hypothetical protein n=1 Tax=Nocardiopsis potens TaxID=1246458 RepID=UPI00034DB247|nr:hypothetical protein [Nocardiopsis potens]